MPPPIRMPARAVGFDCDSPNFNQRLRITDPHYCPKCGEVNILGMVFCDCLLSIYVEGLINDLLPIFTGMSRMHRQIAKERRNQIAKERRRADAEAIKKKSMVRKEAKVKRVLALEARRNHGQDRLSELRKKGT